MKALPRRAVGFRSDTYPWLPVLVEEDLHRRAVGSRCDANPVIPIIVADKELSDGILLLSRLSESHNPGRLSILSSRIAFAEQSPNW